MAYWLAKPILIERRKGCGLCGATLLFSGRMQTSTWSMHWSQNSFRQYSTHTANTDFRPIHSRCRQQLHPTSLTQLKKLDCIQKDLQAHIPHHTADSLFNENKADQDHSLNTGMYRKHKIKDTSIIDPTWRYCHNANSLHWTCTATYLLVIFILLEDRSYQHELLRKQRAACFWLVSCTIHCPIWFYCTWVTITINLHVVLVYGSNSESKRWRLADSCDWDNFTFEQVEKQRSRQGWSWAFSELTPGSDSSWTWCQWSKRRYVRWTVEGASGRPGSSSHSVIRFYEKLGVGEKQGLLSAGAPWLSVLPPSYTRGHLKRV